MSVLLINIDCFVFDENTGGCMRNKVLWWVLSVFFLHKRAVTVAIIHSSTPISRQECLNMELYAF
jgi:hypothetical protein